MFIKKLVKIFLPNSVIKIIKNFYKPFHFYQNLNCDLTNPDQKKVLISYITDPLEISDRFNDVRHTNTLECNQMLRIFINLGYNIDLIYCLDKNNAKIAAKKTYDVILGFGIPFYNAALNNPNAIKIIFLTERYPDFSLKQEQERVNYFEERHSKKVKLRRTNVHFRNEYIKISNYGILFGNDYTLQTFGDFAKKIYTLKPTGLINPNYQYTERDSFNTRKSFVWFGSYGAIHKGLDILIDVFNKIDDCYLYICGLSKEEETIILPLIKSTNIKNMGFVYVNSQEFINLVNQCSFVILPSCSEGMATSVLTCMNHGLIPIVTKETGIDIYDFGFYLESYKVEDVLEIVERCSRIDGKLLNEMHYKVFNYSRDNFNLTVFSRRFSDIIRKILR